MRKCIQAGTLRKRFLKRTLQKPFYHIPGPLGVDARIERRETSQERCRRYKQWMRCHGQEWTTANKIRFINGCRSKDKTISLSQGSSLLPGWCMRRSSTCRGGGTRSWNANPWGCKGWSRLMLVGWRVAGRATPTGRPEQWAPIKTKQQQQQPGKRKWGVRWCEHVSRRDGDDAWWKALCFKMDGQRKGGRPRKTLSRRGE